MACCLFGTQANTPESVAVSLATPTIVTIPSATPVIVTTPSATPEIVAPPLATISRWPANPCTVHHFDNPGEIDTAQVKNLTDEALIEKVTAIASKLDDSSLGEYYDREIYFLEHPTNPETLFVEYDRLYRNHTCQDTTLLRRVDGVWALLNTPNPGMSSYDAASLYGFIWECDSWSLYITAGEGYYMSASSSLYRSRNGGFHWLDSGDLHLLDRYP